MKKMLCGGKPYFCQNHLHLIDIISLICTIKLMKDMRAIGFTGEKLDMVSPRNGKEITT